MVPVCHVCTGINGESSFEASLLERAPGCEVWGYDFTVNSVRSVPRKRVANDLTYYVMTLARECSLVRRLKTLRD